MSIQKIAKKTQEVEVGYKSTTSSSAGSSPSTTPRKLQKNKKNKKGENNNPYATRGLDKFSALLAEIEEKKQKIYAQKNSQDISLVRFMYSESDRCVPIVVKAKKEKDDQTKLDDIKIKRPLEENQDMIKSAVTEENKEESTKNRFSIDQIVYKLRRPSYYLPVVIVFILTLLALSGRSFAILCTCIGWYVIPTLQNGNSQTISNDDDHKNKRPTTTTTTTTKNTKKDYTRKISEIHRSRAQIRNERNSWS
ncbi:hypothetical protein ACFE04_006368 [Oxalis oulophora]